MALNFNELTKGQQAIVRRVYENGFISAVHFVSVMESLEGTWLHFQSHRAAYVLTEDGKRAFEDYSIGEKMNTNQDYGRCHRCDAKLNETTKCPHCGAFNHTDATFARMQRENRKASGFEQPTADTIPAEKRSRFWTPETDAPPAADAAPPTLDYNALTPLQRERVEYAVRNNLTFKYGPTLKALTHKGWMVEDEITRCGYRLTVAGRAARDAHFAAQQAEAIERAVSQSAPLTGGEQPEISPEVQCPHCGNWLFSAYWLERHINIYHKQPDAAPLFAGYKCWHCDEMFRTEDVRLEHANTVHPSLAAGDPCANIDPDDSPATAWEYTKCQLEACRAENAQLREALDAARRALAQIQQMTRSFIEANKAITQVSPTQAFWRIAHVEKIARAASGETALDSEEGN